MRTIFAIPKLTKEDELVLKLIDKQRERLRYLDDSSPRRWMGLLSRNTLAQAIQGSNSIEGYNVTNEDAIAAVENDEPLDPKTEAWRALVGYREAMTYILNLATDPYFEYHAQLIRSLHFMMLNYDIGKHPGQWRPGQVSVINDQTSQVVYQGPNAELVPGLMNELIAQMSTSNGVHRIVRAAMAHLNLTMIHPFSDGNGRMARAVQTLVLAREKTVHPTFSSIEEWLGRNRQPYYDVLAEVGQGSWHPERDAAPWIKFCLRAHYQQMTTLLKRIDEMRMIWEEMVKLVAQSKVPQRADLTLVDAAYGLRITRTRYMSSTNVTEYVASRDLKKIADVGLLIPKGEKRGRFYIGSKQVRQIFMRAQDTTPAPDPYEVIKSATAHGAFPMALEQPDIPGLT